MFLFYFIKCIKKFYAPLFDLAINLGKISENSNRFPSHIPPNPPYKITSESSTNIEILPS